MIDDIEKAHTVRPAQEPALQRKIYVAKKGFQPICLQKGDLCFGEWVLSQSGTNAPFGAVEILGQIVEAEQPLFQLASHKATSFNP